MNKLSAICAGACVGAGLMYLFDPIQGRRRRSLLRDKSVSMARRAQCAMNVVAEDMQNRVQGFVAMGNTWIHPHPVSDEVLVQRVRTKLGRYVSHPHPIEVSCKDGCVTLKGPILSNEVATLTQALNIMPEVKGIANQLTVYRRQEDSPQLQGGCARTGEHLDLFQPHWSPSTRALIGLGGLMLCGLGSVKGSIQGAALLSVGIGMITEAASNKNVKQLLSMTEQQPARRSNIQFKRRKMQVPVESNIVESNLM